MFDDVIMVTTTSDVNMETFAEFARSGDIYHIAYVENLVFSRIKVCIPHSYICCFSAGYYDKTSPLCECGRARKLPSYMKH